LIGLAVAAVSVWLLARQIAWPAVMEALRGVDYRWVGLGVLAIIGTFFARAWRWRVLLHRAQPRFVALLAALLIGQVANMVLSRSGELLRAVWIAPEEESSTTEALGSVAVEKLWDLLALFVAAVLLLLWMPLPEWFVQSVWGTGLLLVLGTVLVGVGLRWQRIWLGWLEHLLSRLPPRWGEALVPRVRRILLGMNSVQEPGLFAPVVGWTICYWGLGALANWAVLRGFGLATAPGALLLLVTLMVGNAASVPVPASLGVFEGIVVVSLALFDVPADQALAVGLVLRLVVMGPPLVGAGLAGVWSRRRGVPDYEYERQAP
jgi:hypothetical protein